MQVIRQPPGTFSVRGHFLRVASVFCWPLAVYTLCALGDYLTGWSFRRRERRLQVSQRRIREVVTALKVRHFGWQVLRSGLQFGTLPRLVLPDDRFSHLVPSTTRF